MPTRLLQTICLMLGLWGLLPSMAQTPEPAQSLNLIANGDFEQGLLGWKLAGNGSANLTNRAGNNPQVLETESWAWVQQDLPMNKLLLGRSYRLSAVGKSASAGCILGFATGKTNTSGPLLEQRLIFQGDWNAKSSLFTLPAEAEWAAVFLAGTGDSCMFDQIRLVEDAGLQPQKNPLIVTNGGFEKGLTGWEVVSGELMRGVGLEGKQSLIARGNALLEQVVLANVFEVGTLYELQVSVSKNSSRGQCVVGFSGASINGQNQSQEMIFDEAMPLRSWLQKSTAFSIADDTAYLTLYIATKDAACSFDAIRIVQRVASR